MNVHVAAADSVTKRPTKEEAEAAVRTLLAWAGDDPAREGLLETPSRVTKAYGEFFSGYRADLKEILGKTFKEVGGYDDMVLVKDIPFSSHCEHHMVPFVGKVHIGYLPDGSVVGLSKLARLVEAFGRRLQVQENMTAQIVDALVEHLKPRGVAVMVSAEHFCMSMRGVRAHGASTVTHKFAGEFKKDIALQDRFLSLVKA